MRVFLDSSVLLAAVGSATGASREVIRRAPQQDWTLIATPYVIDEVQANISRLPLADERFWNECGRDLLILEDIFAIDKPAAFAPAKDRPILFSALAWADVLLTLDRADFGDLLGKSFYDLAILRPGEFLQRERAGGRLSF